MSSSRFVADLKPDPLIRKILMLAACGALLIGLALLMRLPISVLVRVPLCVLWLLGSISELSRQSRGFYRIKAIHLEVGGAAVVDQRGRQEPVQIMSGSVVCPRFAWLRIRCADGLIVGELLRGNSATDKQWRHLQILWRHGLS